MDGLRMKYIVLKAETGEVVKNCFVLRPEKDPAAITAIRAYAAATDNSVLAADLLRWVGAPPNDPLTLDELREMDGEPVWNETMRKWMLVDLQWEYGERAVGSDGKWRGLDDRYYRRRPEEV